MLEIRQVMATKKQINYMKSSQQLIVTSNKNKTVANMKIKTGVIQSRVF